MRAVIIYESMFGNTHRIARAIASGLEPGNEVAVVPVAGAARELMDGADLIVAGGPTHVHGMSKASTRKAAVEQADKSAGQLTLDPNADGPGLRDWLGSPGEMSGLAAAFDTRLAGPAVLTGRASKGIAKLLERRGLTLLAEPESFLVSRDNALQPGEEDRARGWGEKLAARATAGAARTN
jgi:hypothetical protein